MGPSLTGPDALAAVVLAAGGGLRLRPLTRLRPKALCPVGDVPLVDLALRLARSVTSAVAVNVHHGREMMEAHLREVGGPPVHVSVEEPEALGTAGALGRLRPWIDGRDVLVLNADAWHQADLVEWAAGWDRRSVRLLTVRDAHRGTWGDRRHAGAALMPWAEVSRLRPEPTGLYEVSWRHLRPGEGLDLALYEGAFFDCGTPADYLAANLAASGGAPVVGAGARVDGVVERSVIWPGARVWAGERLWGAVRADSRVTVLVRSPAVAHPAATGGGG